MSAAQPKPNENSKTAEAAKAAEPSMEEILASIRKIISDDQVPKVEPEPEPEPVLEIAPEPQPEPPPPIVEEPEEDILDLATMVTHTTSDEAVGEVQADDLDFVPESFAPPEPEPEPVAPPQPPVMPPMPQMAPPPPPPPESLLSHGPNESVSHAFGNLSHMILSQNARTLDDLVKDILRPMLKSWLDDNLPALVERLVKAEIERVARGGR